MIQAAVSVKTYPSDVPLCIKKPNHTMINMAKDDTMYKCERCGQVITVFHGGEGQLVCCGAPMILLQEKTAEEGKEKHLPVITKQPGKVLVACGDIPHPMEANHYIMAISIQTKEGVMIKRLHPGETPEASFCTDSEKIIARAYCNVHGLWSDST